MSGNEDTRHISHFPQNYILKPAETHRPSFAPHIYLSASGSPSQLNPRLHAIQHSARESTLIRCKPQRTRETSSHQQQQQQRAITTSKSACRGNCPSERRRKAEESRTSAPKRRALLKVNFRPKTLAPTAPRHHQSVSCDSHYLAPGARDVHTKIELHGL